MPATAEGQEIATVGDITSHGSPLAPGMGALTVRYGGRAVWRTLVDQHACPVPTHGAGMVLTGAIRTRVSGAFVARKTDIVQEATSINQILPGAVALNQSAGAHKAAGLINEIPGVPDALKMIAPDLMNQLDDLLGGPLDDLAGGLSDWLKGANGALGGINIFDNLQALWENKAMLEQLHHLVTDGGGTEWLSFLANRFTRDDAAEWGRAVLNALEIPSGLLGAVAQEIGADRNNELDGAPENGIGPGGSLNVPIERFLDALGYGDEVRLAAARHDLDYAQGGSDANRQAADRAIYDNLLSIGVPAPLAVLVAGAVTTIGPLVFNYRPNQISAVDAENARRDQEGRYLDEWKEAHDRFESNTYIKKHNNQVPPFLDPDFWQAPSQKKTGGNP